MFSVGRSSIREALKTLANLGIIRRDTVGTTVCAPEEGRYFGISMQPGGDSLEHIFELARIVGVEAAGLAAERATEKQIKNMESALRRTEGMREVTALHFTFHRSLIKSTQNPLLWQTSDVIIRLMAQSKRLSAVVQDLQGEKLKNFIRKIREDHQQILKAVKSNNVQAARRSMLRHLLYLESQALEEPGEQSAGNV